MGQVSLDNLSTLVASAHSVLMTFRASTWRLIADECMWPPHMKSSGFCKMAPTCPVWSNGAALASWGTSTPTLACSHSQREPHWAPAPPGGQSSFAFNPYSSCPSSRSHIGTPQRTMTRKLMLTFNSLLRASVIKWPKALLMQVTRATMMLTRVTSLMRRTRMMMGPN